MRRVEKNHRSKPVGGGGPRLLQGNQVRFPRLGQGPARPSGNLRIPVRDGRGPVEPSRPSRNGTDATIHGTRRRSNHWTRWSTWKAWNSGEAAGTHGWTPIRPNLRTRTVSRACNPCTNDSRDRCPRDSPTTTSPRNSGSAWIPDRSDPRLHDRHIRPRPTAQHHRRRHAEPYGQP